MSVGWHLGLRCDVLCGFWRNGALRNLQTNETRSRQRLPRLRASRAQDSGYAAGAERASGWTGALGLALAPKVSGWGTGRSWREAEGVREAQQGLGRLREAGPGRAPTASRAVRGLGEHACCLPLCLVRPHQGVKPVWG